MAEQVERVRWSECEHLFIVDPEDRRFTVCARCHVVHYRSDDELLEESGLLDGHSKH